MKNNKAMGMISLIIIILIILGMIVGAWYYIKKKYNQVKIETIKTDMLQVQWKVKKYMDDQIVNGVEKQYLGTKIIDKEEDFLIQEFISKNVISEEEYEKYYVLTDEELEKATLEITNYENSYYLINYDTYEIIITIGCEYPDGKKLYKLTEIENINNLENSNIEEKVDTQK